MPFGPDIESALDTLVLDPDGPLHLEPEWLLQSEVPSAITLRPLLDAIGNGAHRVSEIAGRLGRPASSLSAPLASLMEMNLIRRETPFGVNTKSTKRSIYQLSDPFLRLWFRVVAPNRSLLAAVPRETRINLWRRYQSQLEGLAWEELCRMAVPNLHTVSNEIRQLGPFSHAQRYWHGNEPEVDIVSRSISGRNILVGEAKVSASRLQKQDLEKSHGTLEELFKGAIQPFFFAPDAEDSETGNVINAQMVFDALH